MERESEAFIVGNILVGKIPRLAFWGKETGKAKETDNCTVYTNRCSQELQQQKKVNIFNLTHTFHTVHKVLTSLFLLSINTKLAFPPYKTKNMHFKNKDLDAEIIFNVFPSYVVKQISQ
jgi:hypothetical protein